VNVLLENTLLDELRLLVHPYIAGKGKKLFEANLDMNTSLKLIDHKAFNNGVVLLIYRI
jgi:dihydrofolate reductase